MRERDDRDERRRRSNGASEISEQGRGDVPKPNYSSLFVTHFLPIRSTLEPET